MEWLYLALTGMFIWSLTAVVDRYALHGRVASKRFYVAIPALLQFPLTLLLWKFFEPTSFETSVIFFGVVSGLLEMVFLYYFFIALSGEEIGRVFPLMSLGTLFTLLGGFLFLGDTLEQIELVALALLLLGGIFMAFKKRQGGTGYGVSKSIKPLLLGSLLTSGYILTLRYTFLETDFATGFFFFRAGFFLGGLIIVIFWHKELKEQWNALRAKMKIIVLGNQVVAFSGHTFYFSALALANAALVESVLAIQGIMVFALASIVSMINPSLVAESITKEDLLQKIIGIVLITFALYLLV